MKFKVAIRPIGSNGKPRIEDVNAPSRQQLPILYQKMGMEVVEILDEVNEGAQRVMENMSTNQILQMAMQAPAEPLTGKNPQDAPSGEQQAPAAITSPQPKSEPKVVEFTDPSSGIDYKVVDGKVYKKAWVEQESTSFRVIRKDLKSPKILSPKDITVERQDWVPIESEDE